MLLNARRHAAKKPEAQTKPVELDPASSGRWFDGWKRKALGTEVEGSTGPPRPPVARARTWLLTVGWRRHGLLDPTDAPG